MRQGAIPPDPDDVSAGSESWNFVQVSEAVLRAPFCVHRLLPIVGVALMLVALLAHVQGFRTLLSSPWYINLGQYAGDDWAQYYEVEPLAFKVCTQHKSHVHAFLCTMLPVH